MSRNLSIFQTFLRFLLARINSSMHFNQAVLGIISQVIAITLIQVMAVMMTITVDKYIQQKHWSKKSVQDIMFKDTFNLTLVNSILGYINIIIILLWIDHPVELVFTLQRCISRTFSISVLILWNLAQITKIIPKMSLKLGNLLRNIQGTCNQLSQTFSAKTKRFSISKKKCRLPGRRCPFFEKYFFEKFKKIKSVFRKIKKKFKKKIRKNFFEKFYYTFGQIIRVRGGE
jgi:hypothetical protein